MQFSLPWIPQSITDAGAEVINVFYDADGCISKRIAGAIWRTCSDGLFESGGVGEDATPQLVFGEVAGKAFDHVEPIAGSGGEVEALMESGPFREGKLLRMMCSNFSVDAISVGPTYRYPFDIIAKSAKSEKWSGREDSNLRPPGPEPGALPDCATPRTMDKVSGWSSLGKRRAPGENLRSNDCWPTSRF